MSKDGIAESSFRDPSGFVFFKNGTLYRQVNQSYKTDFDRLIDSGFYQWLLDNGLIISHEIADIVPYRPERAYKVIKPEPVPFISYPYEWCFSQLKDAALATLLIQKKALEFNLSLKDSSSYNIQFFNGKPIFIDTLSFESYKEGAPWVAYQQFCKHFFAPLTLMSYADVRLNQLLRIHIDGIPLDLAAKLLPFYTKFKFSTLTHVHLHASAQRRYGNKAEKKIVPKMDRKAFLGLIDSLETSIKKMSWSPGKTEWGNYYDETNYSNSAFMHKKKIVSQCLDRVAPKTVWDLGANTGVFSRIASDRGIHTIAFDIDPAAVEKNYQECREKGETHILPLILDLTNPSPGLGWHHTERMPLVERSAHDTAIALALIHHLAISNNLPFDRIASVFRQLCEHLIIEFVPKSDSQVTHLLSTREDIFPTYDSKNFETVFSRYFIILDKIPVESSERTVYLMKKREIQKSG